MSGLCHVELAAGVERPGTVYFISYVTMGRLYALISGWNLLLYLIIGETMGSGGEVGLKMQKVGEMSGSCTHSSEPSSVSRGQGWERGTVAGKLHNLIACRSILLSLNDGPRNQRKGNWRERVRGRQVPRLILTTVKSLLSCCLPGFSYTSISQFNSDLVPPTPIYLCFFVFHHFYLLAY